MERIKQILLEKGKQISDSAIQAKLKEYGIDGNQINEGDAQSLAKELESQAQPINGLTVASGSMAAPGKSKNPSKGRKSAKNVSLKDAIVAAAKETEGDMATMEKAIRQQKNNYVKYRAESLVDEIANTSTEVVEAVTERLLEVKGDPETFHQIGTELGEGLFPLIS